MSQGMAGLTMSAGIEGLTPTAGENPTGQQLGFFWAFMVRLCVVP